MKNFLIGVLVIAVIVLGYLAFKPKTEVTVSPTPASPSGQTATINNPNGKDYQPSQTSSTWKQSPDSSYGRVLYNDSWSVTQQLSQGVDQLVFTLPTGTKILWGGWQSSCDASTEPFNSYKPGVSTSACVKGARADLQTSSPSTADKQALADFVARNK
jgi:hypothetical protein